MVHVLTNLVSDQFIIIRYDSWIRNLRGSIHHFYSLEIFRICWKGRWPRYEVFFNIWHLMFPVFKHCRGTGSSYSGSWCGEKRAASRDMSVSQGDGKQHQIGKDWNCQLYQFKISIEINGKYCKSVSLYFNRPGLFANGGECDFVSDEKDIIN